MNVETVSRNNENTVVAIMFVTWGVVFLDRMAVLYLAPFIAPDLHLSEAQIGSLAGVIALCWAVSALAFGAISDRVGRKAVLVPMVLLFSLLSALSGLARNFEELLLARALLGFAEGPCWSVTMALVEESSSPRNRGRNIGIVVSAAAIIGLAAAPGTDDANRRPLGLALGILHRRRPGPDHGAPDCALRPGRLTWARCRIDGASGRSC